MQLTRNNIEEFSNCSTMREQAKNITWPIDVVGNEFDVCFSRIILLNNYSV